MTPSPQPLSFIVVAPPRLALAARLALPYSHMGARTPVTSSSSSSSSTFSSSSSSSSAPPPVRTIHDVTLAGTHDSAAYVSVPHIPSRLTARTPLVWRPLRALTSTLASEFALTQTLSVLEQLEAGARFLDLRVTKPAISSALYSTSISNSKEDEFWTHHGIVLCSPLKHVLDQINTFHHAGHKRTVVSVFRFAALDAAEMQRCSRVVRESLHHSVYGGSPGALATAPFETLPHNVLVGLPDAGPPLEWGRDRWIDTYVPDVKMRFISDTLRAARNENKEEEGQQQDQRQEQEEQEEQDKHLLVVGWTITPSIYDIVLRVFSLGLARTPLLPQAAAFNNLFPSFHRDNFALLRSANVVLFDAFDHRLARLVNSLNSPPPRNGVSEDCRQDARNDNSDGTQQPPSFPSSS